MVLLRVLLTVVGAARMLVVLLVLLVPVPGDVRADVAGVEHWCSCHDGAARSASAGAGGAGAVGAASAVGPTTSINRTRNHH